MVSSALNNVFYLYPTQLIIPALVVMFMVAGFSFLGEGLRESLDVKLRPHILIRGRGLERFEGSQPRKRPAVGTPSPS
jgi:hypothetical protein